MNYLTILVKFAFSEAVSINNQNSYLMQQHVVLLCQKMLWIYTIKLIKSMEIDDQKESLK